MFVENYMLYIIFQYGWEPDMDRFRSHTGNDYNTLLFLLDARKPGILREKTKNKCFTIDDKQNYLCCKLDLLVTSFDYNKILTNQLNLIKVLKFWAIE